MGPSPSGLEKEMFSSSIILEVFSKVEIKFLKDE